MSNLADVKQTEVKVNLGGKERILKYNFGAYAKLEEMGHGNFLKTMEDIEGMSMKTIRDVLYVGLRTEDKTISLEQIDSWGEDFEQIQNVIEKITLAITGPLPQTDQAKN